MVDIICFKLKYLIFKIFFGDNQVKLIKDNIEIATGFSDGTLYKITFDPAPQLHVYNSVLSCTSDSTSEAVAVAPCTENEYVWHCCLGHPSQSALTKLLNNNMVDGMNFSFTAGTSVQ